MQSVLPPTWMRRFFCTIAQKLSARLMWALDSFSVDFQISWLTPRKRTGLPWLKIPSWTMWLPFPMWAPYALMHSAEAM